MVFVLYNISHEDLINEAASNVSGQDFIVRSVLGLTGENEFLPTGFNDCWELVKEQMDRAKR